MPAAPAVLVDAEIHWPLKHPGGEPTHRGIGRALFAVGVLRSRQRRLGPRRVKADPFSVGFYERCGARLVGRVPAPVLEYPSTVT